VDIVSPQADFSGYKLVIVPALYVLAEETAASLEAFVREGGVLIVTARSGVKDLSNAVVDAYLPGLLAEVCGLAVDDYDVLPAEAAEKILLDLPGGEGAAAEARLWLEVLRPDTAQVVGSYASGYMADSPAVTLNAYGQGQALYVGTLGGNELQDLLVGWALKAAGLLPVHAAPLGVEITTRWQGERPFLFVLNHTQDPQQVSLNGTYQDLVREETLTGTISIPPLDVYVLTPV
jgi:beta-galactosidase